jgi:hypothetical protein
LLPESATSLAQRDGRGRPVLIEGPAGIGKSGHARGSGGGGLSKGRADAAATSKAQRIHTPVRR